LIGTAMSQSTCTHPDMVLIEYSATTMSPELEQFYQAFGRDNLMELNSGKQAASALRRRRDLLCSATPVIDSNGHSWSSTAHCVGGRRNLQEEVEPTGENGDPITDEPGGAWFDEEKTMFENSPDINNVVEVIDANDEVLDPYLNGDIPLPCKGGVNVCGGRDLQELDIPAEFEPEKYNCESKGNARIVNAANAADLVLPEDANVQLIHCCLK
jgi:hypothetical protein